MTSDSGSRPTGAETRVGTGRPDAALGAEAFLARHRPRQEGALPLLKAVLTELVEQVGSEQARNLMFLAGVRVAEMHALEDVDRLSDFERAARELLARYDWGWLRLEMTDDSVEFVHGDAPLETWFGEQAQRWAPAFFEGLYSAWLRRLGAGEALQLRQVETTATAGSREIRFRLMHESRF